MSGPFAVSDAARRKAEERGEAREGGSWPIRNKVDLKNAIQAIGRAKPSEREAVKRWIIKRARELDAADLLPESWNIKHAAATHTLASKPPSDFGACVVAIPAASGLPDALEGGQHVTVAYLGDDPLPGAQAATLQRSVADIATQWKGPVDAKVNGTEFFGPEETAHVVVLDNGEDSPLVSLRAKVIEALTPELRAAFDAAETYPDYKPHLTLGYTDEGYEPDPSAALPDSLRLESLGVWNGADRQAFPLGVNERAYRLGLATLALERWLTHDFNWVEEVVGADAPVDTYNWVEDAGGLPPFIKRISKHLRAKGMAESHAIATSVNVVKKMCATGDTNWPGKQDVNAGSRAEACAAVARWEQMKQSHSANTLTAGGEVDPVAALLARYEEEMAVWDPVGVEKEAAGLDELPTDMDTAAPSNG